MSDLISRRHLIKSLKGVCTVGGIFEKPQREYLNALSELVKHEPSIEEKEGVRIIWQHQIDDLIKQIEDIPTIKESDTGKMILMGEGMKREVIKILEEAKK